LIAPRPGVEPATFRSRVQRSTNATTKTSDADLSTAFVAAASLLLVHCQNNNNTQQQQQQLGTTTTTTATTGDKEESAAATMPHQSNTVTI